MLLYLDSSSIVKLYVDEEHSTETRDLAGAADRLAASLIAFVEVKAAFARRRRERRIRSRSQYQRLNEDFEADWPAFHAPSVSEPVVASAADLVGRHPLSAYDAVHLAAALSLKGQTPKDLLFSSWDDQLVRAAQAEGLSLAHEEPA